MERKQLNIFASVVAIPYTSRHTWSPTARASCLFNGVLNTTHFSLHLLLTDARHRLLTIRRELSLSLI